jgi:excisionase family DNA binding protein
MRNPHNQGNGNQEIRIAPAPQPRFEPQIDRDRLLTIAEVALLTGLTVGTLYHFVSQQRIPVVRISKRCIRFRQSHIYQWWEELTQQAIGEIR